MKARKVGDNRLQSVGELTLLFHRNRRRMSYNGRSNCDGNRVNLRMLVESGSE